MGSPEHRHTAAGAASAWLRAPGGAVRPARTGRGAGEGTR
jgi:hypothetical protein